MTYKRKTVDCWRFYVNYGYGHGWEHEHTELTRAGMKENRRLYRENCPYPLRIVFGRERIEAPQPCQVCATAHRDGLVSPCEAPK